MTDSHADVLRESSWTGGAHPFGIGSKKLGMWLFIVSDTLTFAALLLVYSYSRLANPNWPRPFPIVPAIIFSTIMTVVLLGSSLTMVMGVAAAHRGNRSATVKWMLATMLGGAIFCGLHATEWMHLIHEGLTPFANPWGGSPLFGATFFGITGLHMTHVAIGVIYLGIVATGFGRGKFSAEDVEVSGLYWHFVDLVWMFVFPMIYLMSVKY
ncbi:MAG: cytochrome c oxidase subunit 3 [Acidobacteria bacterium]|nr:cytochrome c oxidase subunit 3 [Acidobacteriota bacterium]MBI3664199.1 cytochrome c oxidase subunit 3 [Acidobacteriota bacterium]